MRNILVDHMHNALPDICRVKDLVNVGIYRNAQSAYHARRDGVGPPFFRIPKTGIVYMKKDVIDFFEKLKKRISSSG